MTDEAANVAAPLEGKRTCAFCGASRVLTREHVFPKWAIDLVHPLLRPQSATRVTQREDHQHDHWGTSVVDLTVKRFCSNCNAGWMSELEARAQPILTPLIQRPGPQTITPAQAVVIATWATKTTLTASLLHSGDPAFVPASHFEQFHGRRRPFKDSMLWVAAYDAKRYPASSTTVPIYELNGYRTTVNLGCFAYQLVVADDLSTAGIVVPPGNILPYMTRLWPVENEDVHWRPLVMSEDELRLLAGIDDHSWEP